MIHLSAQVEPFGSALGEMLPLLPRHYAELALDQEAVPLQPRWDVYARMEAAGELLVVTLRAQGKLVGYAWLMVAPSLHYGGTLHATTDIFWVMPEYRGRMGGRRLFRAVEEELRRRGVVRWLVASKLHRDSGRLMRACGMRPIETVYSKLLTREAR